MQHSEIVKLIQGELSARLAGLTIIPRHRAPSAQAGKATVLIGMRRVGKTFCLFRHIKALESQGIPRDSILFLNLEDDRLRLENVAELTNLIDQFYSDTPANHSRHTVVMLDEIQTLPGWERVARRLVETAKCELWLTGSSAKMLSKEVASKFRGRSIAYEIWPFDFFEYLAASHIKIGDPSVSFEQRDLAFNHLKQYLLQGGFPELVNLAQDFRRRVLEDYRDAVILRDVIERHHVTNLRALEALVSTVIANSGRLLSVNKLTADFKSRGIKVGKDTIFEYLGYLEDAFLAFSVSLYSEWLRARSTTPKKCFCIDTGMVANYSLRPEADLGRLFENLVFIDLKRQGYRLHYYVTKSGSEVDFVVVGSTGQNFVVQVCLDISETATRLREENSLHEAMRELGCGGILVTPREYTQGYDWIPKLE